MNSEEEWEDDEEEGAYTTAQPLWVLPLYSLLPSYKQAKVSITVKTNILWLKAFAANVNGIMYPT